MAFFQNPLKEPLKKIDRFGDAAPQPKRAITGLVSICVYTFLFGYAIYTGVQYDHEPALQENDVLWSAYHGPYPLNLTCAAERCWVSMSLRGAYGPCIDDVPETQQDTCLEMQHGESLTLRSCYALLPSRGVRLYFEGATATLWESLAPGLGMGEATDAEFFGLYSVSDMLMPNLTVRPTKTPLREGVTLMTYVHTENKTVAEGEAAADRHEWFSQILDQTPSSEPDDAPCAAQLGTSAGSVHTSVLRMAPDFTQIEVTPNPPYWMMLYGEVGGALAACDELLGLTLILVVNLLLEVSNRRKAKADEKTDADVGVVCAVDSAVHDATGMEDRIRQLVAEATADLTRRLAKTEAALQRHEQRLREVVGPSNRQSPLSGCSGELLRPKTARPAMAPEMIGSSTPLEDFCEELDLGSLDQRFKAREEQSSKVAKAPSSVGSTRESTSLSEAHGRVEGPGDSWLAPQCHANGNVALEGSAPRSVNSILTIADATVAAEDSVLRSAADRGSSPSSAVVTAASTRRCAPEATLPNQTA